MTNEKKKYQHDYYMKHKDKYKEYVKKHKEKIELDKHELEIAKKIIALNEIKIKWLKQTIKDLKVFINLLGIMIIGFSIYMSFVGVGYIANDKDSIGWFLIIMWSINMILMTRFIININKEDK